MKKTIATLFVTLLACGCAVSSNAASTTAIADANTRQSNDGNYGASTYVGIEYGSQARDGWFMFDTSGIKSAFDAQYGARNWAVNGISFNGYSWEKWNYARAGSFAISYNTNDSWTETGISWSSQPVATDETLLSSWAYNPIAGADPALQTIAFGTSNLDLVNDIVNGSLVSIHMKSNGGEGASQIAWESKEFDAQYGAQYVAYLDVSAEAVHAVPEPASILALASGLISLTGFVTRRRA